MSKIVQIRILLGLSLSVALLSLGLAAVGFSTGFAHMRHHFAENFSAFGLHVVGAAVALLLGGFQFFPRIRRNLTRHRWIGRVYAVSLILGAISGFKIAFTSVGGLSSQVAFAILAALWIVTTITGIWHIRKGRVQAHQDWMIRSFALTFAGVTYRLWLLVFMLGFGLDYAPASAYVAWFAFVPNILVAEWLLFRKRPRQRKAQTA